MATLEAWIIRLHVAAGVIALGAGAVALLATKGGRRHRRAGKGFVASMAVVVVTVFPLLALDFSGFRVFLALVAVFSGYLAFSGYRSVPRHGPAGRAGRLDWVAAIAVLIASLALGGWGLARLADGQRFGVVLVVFGGIGLGFGAMDARSFLAGSRADGWMVTHLQRMVGAVIATVSAVSAVNLTGVIGVAAWLWPTAVGVPLIVYWSARYSGD